MDELCNKWLRAVAEMDAGLMVGMAPITTAADDKICDIFSNFQKKKGMISHENRLPADDSYEISCLICYC